MDKLFGNQWLTETWKVRYTPFPGGEHSIPTVIEARGDLIINHTAIGSAGRGKTIEGARLSWLLKQAVGHVECAGDDPSNVNVDDETLDYAIRMLSREKRRRRKAAAA